MARFGPNAAYLLEIFRSFQGEGLFTGAPQVFVRFAGCHLRCIYCDTPESWTVVRTCDAAGATLPNPLPSDVLLRIVRDLAARGPTHSISITGGEPLLQVAFLERALPALRAIRPIHLDTSGSLPEALARVADLVDTVALDVKLPSTPGARVPWEEIEACLRLAARRDSFVKIVLIERHDPRDVEEAAGRIARAAPRLPVFLQPATPVGDGVRPPPPETVRAFRGVFARRGLHARILPQMHVLMGWK
jgi:organic radical activating enzyme